MSMNSRLMMKTRAFARVSTVLSIAKFDTNLETVYRCYHDDRYQRKRSRTGRDNDDKVHKLQRYVNRMYRQIQEDIRKRLSQGESGGR